MLRRMADREQLGSDSRNAHRFSPREKSVGILAPGHHDPVRALFGRPRGRLAGLAWCLLGACSPAEDSPSGQTSDQATGSEDRPPNVVLILVDDLGLEALNAYGGTSYQTPAIDRLAATGMVFEHCFATPSCTASRVQLLTGQYPFRTGWDRLQGDRPPDDRTLDVGLPSVGRALKSRGYATAIAGKWHLAHFSQAPNHVTEMGFDEHCVWTHKLAPDSPIPRRYWKPSIWQNGKFHRRSQKDAVYGPEVFTEFLSDFIQRHRDQPFFAFYSMCLVHRPYVATPDDVGELRTARVEETPVKKGEAVPQQLARFGSNVACMDRLVGHLIRRLQELDLIDNTVILFTSDNGTDARLESRMGSRIIAGGKTQMNDRGAAVPLIVSWQGKVAAGSRNATFVDFTDFLPTLVEVSGGDPGPLNGDGTSFLPVLQGRAEEHRETIYVEEAGRWFVRGSSHALDHTGQLFDVSDRFAWKPVSESPSNESIRAVLSAQLESVRSRE